MAETIRACRREDIPTVAGMFSRVFLTEAGAGGRAGALFRRTGVRRPTPPRRGALTCVRRHHRSGARLHRRVAAAHGPAGPQHRGCRRRLADGRAARTASHSRRAAAARFSLRPAGSFLQRDVERHFAAHVAEGRRRAADGDERRLAAHPAPRRLGDAYGRKRVCAGRVAEPAGEDRRPCHPGAQQTPALVHCRGRRFHRRGRHRGRDQQT